MVNAGESKGIFAEPVLARLVHFTTLFNVICPGIRYLRTYHQGRIRKAYFELQLFIGYEYLLNLAQITTML